MELVFHKGRDFCLVCLLLNPQSLALSRHSINIFLGSESWDRLLMPAKDINFSYRSHCVSSYVCTEILYLLSNSVELLRVLHLTDK